MGICVELWANELATQMDKFRIRGGKPLHGTVQIAGAKNSALPLMAAALLTAEPVTLQNIPIVRDIVTMAKLLAFMSATVSTAEIPASTYTIQSEIAQRCGCPVRAGEDDARVDPDARPGHRALRHGACFFARRLRDRRAPRRFASGGARENGRGHCHRARLHPGAGPHGGRLTGAHIVFEKITVTGTENILMAAALADGVTTLENCACEPEIHGPIHLLRKMGAHIEGDDTSTLRKFSGVEKLHGASHSVIPDRIEAGTFLIAGAITNGDLTIVNCNPAHLGAVIAKLESTGVHVEISDASTLRVHDGRQAVAADVITEEYPGFATDMQAQYMALATQAEGTSVITETIFENRFLHASEMARMGAHITIDGRRAVVRGPASLSGTIVQASDLRASAGLVLAALVASGETLIDRVYHIDRGYERIVEKLSAVGADVERLHGSGQ